MPERPLEAARPVSTRSWTLLGVHLSRIYSKVGPGFWNGPTGRALKRQGPETLIVGMYLMTCQHANMLGLYYLSKAYIADDTGLGLEGASKGLRGAIEAGFCLYDDESGMVWVPEMAAHQVAERLEASDNRCKGIQRAYDDLPENPFLALFYDKYGPAFHMVRRREFGGVLSSPLEAPSKPGTGTGARTEGKEPSALVAEPPRLPACPAQELVELFHRHLPMMPRVMKLSDARRKVLNARWREVVADAGVVGDAPDARAAALEWFELFFRRCAESRFLTGRNSAWRASFDWLLAPGNFLKAAEGNYDGESR